MTCLKMCGRNETHMDRGSELRDRI